MSLSLRRAAWSALVPVLLPVLSVAAPAAHGAPPGAPAPAYPEPRVRAADPVDLARPAHGAAAVRRLGDRFDEAAHLNGMRPRELRALLLDDTTAWVDTDGRLFYRDEPQPAATVAAADVPRAPYPLAETFALHSSPGSTRTIHLDFDGHWVGGTQWNADAGLPQGSHPAWSLDGSAAFSDAERAVVQDVWQRVAEDYAPFDVDVTTEDPGAAGINRASSTDRVYGTRALVSPSTVAHDAICGDPAQGGGCGGVAYLDVFDEVGSWHDAYQPAWVFPHMLADDGKNIAEAIAHEVGHNLSLDHDGRTTPAEEYYSGHGFWAPIMGGGYEAAVVQWSKGDYGGASNRQDDLADITASGLSLRADEAGGTTATAAAAPPTGTAYVSERSDVDVYALGTCSGAVTVTGLNAPTSPDLDLRLRLLSTAGTQVALANPVSTVGTPWWDVADGTDATLSATVPSGTYFVEVDGVGNGSWTDQYDDYGSLGAYRLSTTGCSDAGPEPEPGAPGAPSTLLATADAVEPTVDLVWDSPADDGGSPVTGYTVTGSPGGLTRQLPADARATTFTGLAAGTTYSFSVTAENAAGPGPAATASARTADDVPDATVPGAPADLRVGARPLDGALDVFWDEPADGGSALLGYRLAIDGETFEELFPAGWTGLQVTGLTRGATYAVSLRAVNAVGAGPAAGGSVTMAGAPPAPVGVDLAVVGTTGTVAWGSPSGYDLALVTGWRVRVLVDGAVHGTTTTSAAATRSVVWEDLPAGQVRLGVSAVSGDLVGTEAGSPTRTVGPTPPPPAVTAPGAPRIGKAFPGPRRGPVTAGVRWTAPTSTGGAAVTGYRVVAQRLDRQGRVVRTLRTGVLRAGARSVELRLARGRYRFAVRARNSVGYGAPSATSRTVTAR